MLPRGFLKNLDAGLIGSSGLLALIGLASLYSLGRQDPSGWMSQFSFNQAMWLVAAVILGIACWTLNYRLWDRFSWALYIVNIALLVGLLIAGMTIKGEATMRTLGAGSIQPSELAKVLFIVTFAGYLARYREEMDKLLFLSLAAAQFILPFILIMLQPDLGTAIVFIIVFFAMLYVSGVDWLTVFVSMVALVSAGLAASPFALKEYQFKRLISFINPDADPLGSGYQLVQSKIAIGSGGLWGTGLLDSPQSGLGFLPASHTDFIFSSICEQAGFIGGAAVILLFAWFLFRVVRIASQSEDLFAVYIAAGIFAMIAGQAIINIAMTMGLCPITGLPLPFVSYGGSSMLVNAVAVGLLLNISIRRRKIMFG
ncbi:MAG TPA: rod shape-determining protein RodA [bacterium]|nr:rod shape-determining protein RodA [bacterium]